MPARLPVAVLLDEMTARKEAILEAAAFGPGLESLKGAVGMGPEDGEQETAVASHP